MCLRKVGHLTEFQNEINKEGNYPLRAAGAPQLVVCRSCVQIIFFVLDQLLAYYVQCESSLVQMLAMGPVASVCSALGILTSGYRMLL